MKENILEELKSMKNNDVKNLNMFEGGGAEVLYYNHLWFLWEIPRYGGTPIYQGYSAAPKAIEAVISAWT